MLVTSFERIVEGFAGVFRNFRERFLMSKTQSFQTLTHEKLVQKSFST